ncbi:hypothetical protein N180_03060 [Pedobacter antarcticus 4BY]|uniref:Uncharacterized protein n=2 Tax=Pedobacter antarcticus TaxID=34086 RepID=A0A081PKL9_9SPHI|nr:hypothetical protein [Pedobacter antarcticus]KEQ31242.1 hypothetical protein N180_03060 [Pedobacter antarcticus 4BY]SFE56074.1 hypothetical protein SAMN03003324_00897 [Pedobacter antarcticus]
MKIAYLHKAKIKAKPKTDELLEGFYARDIRLTYNKKKKILNDLGISEIQFVAALKKRIGTDHGIFGY